MGEMRREAGKKRKIALFLSVIMLGALVAIAVEVIRSYQSGDANHPIRLFQQITSHWYRRENFFAGRERVQVLVLGTDTNWTEKNIMYTKNTRSDTMILATLLLEQKKINLLSIPRDTRVEIPGRGFAKINEAHAIGGVPLTLQTVQAFLGVPIDYHVRIKVSGLKNLVDAMGGVDVAVEKDMDYDDNWGHLHIHLKKGLQRLNGEQAMGYSRFRHDEEGDYGRVRRQQQLTKCIQKRIAEPEMLLRIPQLAQVATENVESDLTASHLVDLAQIYKGIQSKDIRAATLPTTPQDFVEGGYEVSYVVLDDERAKSLLDRMARGIPPLPQEIRVEVLNATGANGLARKVGDILKNYGYQISYVGNAKNPHSQRTRVIDHTGSGGVEEIARIIGDAEVAEDNRADSSADITVVVGSDCKL
ncbi:MAG: LCP family protein [Armatimonadetes bacterium]|nr:LCP family protein [Armatimonadota bacterium]